MHICLKPSWGWGTKREEGRFTAHGVSAVWEACRIDDSTEVASACLNEQNYLPIGFRSSLQAHKLHARLPMWLSIDPMSLCLSVLQEITLHASLPPGLRGPMAGHQQEVSNLSSWHRNTAEPWQLMRFLPLPLLVNHPRVVPAFFHPGLPALFPPLLGAFAKMSPDFMWHHHPSDSRFTEPSQDN